MPERPLKRDQRRKDQRIAGSVPILFEWHNQNGEVCRTRGSTQDFSQGGLYNYVEQPLPLDTAVTFHAALPAPVATGESQNFRCNGRVLRTENLGSHYGVAVSLESRESEFEGGESNRRVNRRVMPFSSIPVRYPGMSAVVRDLSPTGAFIEDKRPLPVGRRLELTLDGAGVLSEVSVKAVVRRTEPHVGMAVEFEAIGKDSSRNLSDFVTRARK